MVSNFQIKYSETEDVLMDICRLNSVSKVMVNHRLTVGVVGFAAALVLLKVSDFFVGNTPMRVLLYIGYWVLAFAIGEILGRTLGMSFAATSGEGEGRQVYKQRIQKWGQPLEIKVEFYDDYFTTWAKGLQKRKVPYADVLEMIESKETYAIIARSDDSPQKKLYAFPKSGLQNISEEKFKEFVDAKCVNSKKGCKTYNYKYK